MAASHPPPPPPPPPPFPPQASEASSAQGSSCKVSESQVAFMVECYLRDRRFTKTLAQFRSEAASSLNPLKSVPKGARSLSAVLNEYVALKEHHIALNQEKARADVLFKGLQEVLSAYHSGNRAINRQTLLPPNELSLHSSAPSDQIEVESRVQRTPSTLSKRTRINECNNGITEAHPSCLKLSIDDAYNTAEAAKKPRLSSSCSSSVRAPYRYVQQGSIIDQGLSSAKPSVIQPATPPMKAENTFVQQQAVMVPLTPSNIPLASEQSSPPPDSACPNNTKDNPSISRNQAFMLPKSKRNSRRTVDKRAFNKKCRLLDFSSSPKSITKAAGNPQKQSIHQSSTIGHGQPIVKVSDPASHREAASSPPCLQLPASSVQSCGARTEMQMEASTLAAHDIIPFPNSGLSSCDAISLDDLFNIELDTELLSQLEDLQAIGDIKGMIDAPASPIQLLFRSDENFAKLFSSKLPSRNRSILNDRANIPENCVVQHEAIQAQDTGFYSCTMTSPNRSKSPLKHGSSISELEDKENKPSLFSAQA